MKTFRFTMPEFPLSAVEKRQHNLKSKDSVNSIVETEFFNTNGSLNDRALEYMQFFNDKELGEFSSYSIHFFKFKLMEAVWASLGYVIVSGAFLLLLSWELSSLLKPLANLWMFFLAYVIFSFFRLKGSYNYESELMTKLLKAEQDSAHQSTTRSESKF